MLNCGKCGKYACHTVDDNDYPKVCPTQDEQELLAEALKLYEDEENHKLAYNAAKVEAEGYCKWTRLEETIDFMKKCGYKKIGIAFCVGLKNETKTLIKILEHYDFEVVSVICKNGSFPKDVIGIGENDKIKGKENGAMCNPIGQAMLLNKEKVDFNILFGLCVGHDSLAVKYLEAPVTILVVKDRVLCHNPIGAIYQADAYYSKKLYK